MNNLTLKEMFQKGHQFAKKYLKEYLLLLAKPIAIGLFGGASVLLSGLGIFGAILALIISLPCMCYAFWQGYLITFSLNYLALDFLKEENNTSLLEYYQLSKTRAGAFAKFLFLSMIASIIVLVPSIVYILNSGISTDFNVIAANCIVLTINALVLVPFFNFIPQAFFFKTEEEGFSEAFTKCYKIQDSKGIFLSVFFLIVGSVIGINLVVYVFLALILNLYAYSINTFWYYSRIQTKEE